MDRAKDNEAKYGAILCNGNLHEKGSGGEESTGRIDNNYHMPFMVTPMKQPIEMLNGAISVKKILYSTNGIGSQK